MSICPRLEVYMLPKDRARALSSFQKDLASIVNHNRSNDERLGVLVATFKAAIQHIEGTGADEVGTSVTIGDLAGAAEENTDDQSIADEGEE